MTETLSLLKEKTIKCLDHGFVTLVDVMPGILPEGIDTADFAIVQAARVSYGAGTKTLNEDRGLIRYLMRHKHTTPFEMVEFKFCCKMPIFVARQWIRHRTANVNEYSARYSVVKDEYYIPELKQIRKQSNNNKQGGNESVDFLEGEYLTQTLEESCKIAYKKYEEYTSIGIARELARCVLPVNYYTEWYWKIDLHNLLHFLALRCDSHAQYEIRVFADAMLNLIQPIVPITIESWEDYHPMRGAVTLSRLELEALKTGSINTDNKRERQEWEDKLKKINSGV